MCARTRQTSRENKRSADKVTEKCAHSIPPSKLAGALRIFEQKIFSRKTDKQRGKHIFKSVPACSMFMRAILGVDGRCCLFLCCWSSSHTLYIWCDKEQSDGGRYHRVRKEAEGGGPSAAVEGKPLPMRMHAFDDDSIKCVGPFEKNCVRTQRLQAERWVA